VYNNIMLKKGCIATNVGYVGAAWSDSGLVVLTLPWETLSAASEKLEIELAELSSRRRVGISEAGEGNIFAEKIRIELGQYFSGMPTVFTLPVDWSFCTPFRKEVLAVVKGIPWGEVRSYGQVAALAGNPKAARAVGGAMGSNRMLLVIPCHRVISHNGTLGGFGGGLPWKQRLLKMEGIALKQQ
jgi:methylated-DNA-[protein]-cysteine S-methyltransferase